MLLHHQKPLLPKHVQRKHPDGQCQQQPHLAHHKPVHRQKTHMKVEHIENDYLAAWPDEPDLEPDEDDYFNDKPSDSA